MATRLLSFAFKVYISRALGAEVVGLYQISLSIVCMLVSVAFSGMPLVLSRKIAALDNPKSAQSGSYITSGLLVCAGSAAVIILVLYAASGLLDGIFADPRCKPLFLIMLPALLSSSVYSVLRSWFLGRRSYTAFSFTEFLEELFRVIFSVLFAGGIVFSLSGATGIALALTIADFCSMAVLTAIYFKRGGRLNRPFELKPLIRSSAPLTLMRIFGSVVGSATAILIPLGLVASGLTASEATAEYGRVAGMALPLIMAPMSITGALAVVLIPEIVAAYARGKNGLKDKIEGSVLFSYFISSLFIMLYIPLGEEITRFIFNDSTACMFVKYSALIIYPLGLTQITNSILNSLGQEKSTFKNYIAGTSLLLLAVAILPRHIGIYAIAVGFGLCYTVTTIMNIIKLKKIVSFDFGRGKLLLLTAFIAPSALLAYFLKGILSVCCGSFFVIAISATAELALFLTLTSLFNIIDLKSFIVKTKIKTKKTSVLL